MREERSIPTSGLQAARRGFDRIIAHVKLPQEEKGKAIGKGGCNIQLVRSLMKRHHTVADVSLE